MQEEFVFSGFGGQGVMFIGQLLAYAAMDNDMNVTWIPSYGPEMRGGTAHCFVVISDKMIGSPVVSRPGVGVIFNRPSFGKYEPVIARNGLLVVNSSLVPEAETRRDDLTLLKVPATDLAYELENARLANVIMMGAILTMRPVLPVAALRQALDNHIPAHRRGMLEANYQALRIGADFISKHVSA
jgi:2-oxoglutarate ferredoxin oxidoreductase subunit gamma